MITFTYRSVQIRVFREGSGAWYFCERGQGSTRQPCHDKSDGVQKAKQWIDETLAALFSQ